MKKLILSLVMLLLLVSCTIEDADDNITIEQNGKIYVINTLGDLGSLSYIDTTIHNDAATIGKWSNDIKHWAGYFYIVNSGNNNVKVFSKNDFIEHGSAELPVENSNPMKVAFANGKMYVTSLFGNGVDLFSISGLNYLRTITVEGANNGCDAIVSDGNYVYVNRNNYWFDQNWNATYEEESILKINSNSDTIVDSLTVGVNIADMIIDQGGDIHCVASGNFDDITGKIHIINSNTFELRKTLDIGSYPTCITLDNYDYAYVGTAPYTTIEGKIYKYDAYENILLDDNLLYTNNNSGILDICSDNKNRIFFTLFNIDSVGMLENDQYSTSFLAGDGPQNLIFVYDDLK